ncbi:MAG: TIM44-like domain-containing protein [Elusimicrobia bacterium]|nr:TIM44-like domain-containing protein [Elusimicrobiota bacterium]
MPEERLTLRDLGFDFGPDPFGDKALMAKLDAFVRSPEFFVLVGFGAVYAAYWFWVHSRARAESLDAVVIARGRERQAAQSRTGALKEIKKRDQYFDEDLFLHRAEEAFLRVRDALGRGDLSAARAFLSDGMFERLRRGGGAPSAGPVKVLERRALGYGVGWHFDSVSVRFKVLEGEEAFEEIWTFLRRPGAATLARGGAIEGFCPSCGAPVSIVDAVRCASCKSWINSGEHDWVAVESTAPWEWRFADPRRDVTAWAPMREHDPDLSLESLEDRAAVVFWRWIDARRRRDRAPLRGVATTEFVSALALEAPFEGGALLGAAETVAFEQGEEMDAAHVQVRWEHGGERRTDTMIFRRRAGALSDRKAGLSATRCPGCGAAPEQADAEKCAYCALPFNDGSRSWVLSEIAPFGTWSRPEEAPGSSVLPGIEGGEDVAPADAVAAMAACLAVDGALHYRELAYLDKYAERRGMTSAQVEKIVEEARAGRLPYAAPFGADRSLLSGLIRMSLADGYIEDSERALLAMAARRAGVHEMELKEMIRRERAALAARARELLARLS